MVRFALLENRLILIVKSSHVGTLFLFLLCDLWYFMVLLLFRRVVLGFIAKCGSHDIINSDRLVG